MQAGENSHHTTGNRRHVLRRSLPAIAPRGAGRALRRCGDWLMDIVAPLSGEHLSFKATLEEDDEAMRRMAFTFAAISLSAGVARSRGGLSRGEYLAFCAAFPLGDEHCLTLRRLFSLAWEDTATPDQTARRVMYLYPEKPALYESLLAQLWRIAGAEAEPTGRQLRYIAMLAASFGFSRSELSRILERAEQAEKDPFHVLGLPAGASNDRIKARYRELMRSYHPDRMARAQFPETRALAEMKSARFNEAYRQLRG